MTFKEALRDYKHLVVEQDPTMAAPASTEAPGPMAAEPAMPPPEQDITQPPAEPEKLTSAGFLELVSRIGDALLLNIRDEDRDEVLQVVQGIENGEKGHTQANGWELYNKLDSIVQAYKDPQEV